MVNDEATIDLENCDRFRTLVSSMAENLTSQH